MVNRAELKIWLRNIDQAQRDGIDMISADIEALPEGERKQRLTFLRSQAIDRNVDFHGALFETDDGAFISLSQLNLAT